MEGNFEFSCILSRLRFDCYSREKSCADLAGELSGETGLNISATTIWRILKRAGLRKTKPKIKAEGLTWCLEHQHWTLEDIKNVIRSDETSVVLFRRRRGYRIWRSKDEAFV